MKFWIAPLMLLAFTLLFFQACSNREEEAKGEWAGETGTRGVKMERRIRKEALKGGPYPAILIAQAQFIPEKDEKGEEKSVPGPAKMVLLRKAPEGWETVVVEDPASNVFHKAMSFDLEGEEGGILTIGGTKAALKIWRWKDPKWEETLLWQPTFGGKFDRLRDVEIGDVNGDGKPEIVVVTHDQGVVAVLEKKGEKWEPTEVDREPEIFVHEVEIGDVDRDGKNEFFATPSKPNKAGVSQAGQVVMFRWNGKSFQKTVIEDMKNTHVKEILVADVEGKGTDTLFSVLEGEKGEDEWGDETVVSPVEIRRYSFSEEGITSEVVGTLDDSQCRFLCAGDINSDGRKDLVAAGMGSGLWVFWRQEDGSWKPELIDENSSGYEHSTVLGDLDEDGKPEIYVAADKQGILRSYTYTGEKFKREELMPISGDEITWNLMPGKF